MSPQRNHPAHPPPVERHNEPVILFVTVSTVGRTPMLAAGWVHEALRESWAEARHWSVGFYVVMPEHVHLFCAPSRRDHASVKEWSRYWKGLVGKREPRLRGQFLADCWDTQMRTQEHYLTKLEYTRLNPVRRGLAALPEEWPYMGSLHPIAWV